MVAGGPWVRPIGPSHGQFYVPHPARDSDQWSDGVGDHWSSPEIRCFRFFSFSRDQWSDQVLDQPRIIRVRGFPHETMVGPLVQPMVGRGVWHPVLPEKRAEINGWTRCWTPGWTIGFRLFRRFRSWIPGMDHWSDRKSDHWSNSRQPAGPYSGLEKSGKHIKVPTVEARGSNRKISNFFLLNRGTSSP